MLKHISTVKLVLISLFGLGAGLFTLYAHAQSSPSPLQASWQAAIHEARMDADLIGVGGAILYKGKIVAQAVDGLQIKGKSRPLETDNLFHIGSISKSMTATLLARLVENGTLSWDSSVQDTFPNVDMHPDWNGVTMAHFLTHTSGVQANFPRASQSIWPTSDEALRTARLKAVSALLSNPPQSKPDEVFRYSNAGITIAGVMAEQITGKSWESLMHTEVFAPLGMKSAGFGAPQSTQQHPQPWGHTSTLGFKRPMDPSKHADNTPIMGPAGIIHMNMRDLLIFGNEHALGMQGKSTFLKPETFKRLHTPKLNNYAYGFVVQPQSKWTEGPILWHNGTNTMWYALLVIAPDRQAVFVMTSNDGSFKKAETALFPLPQTFESQLTKGN